MVASADTLLRAVDDRLSELLLLENNWDSYGGKPPTVTAILIAGRLTQRVYDRYGGLVGDRVLPTAISPLAFGGVELEWEDDRTLLALDIGPNGGIGGMMRRSVGEQADYREADEIEWDEALNWVGESLGIGA